MKPCTCRWCGPMPGRKKMANDDFENWEERDLDIRSEAEDVAAPAGRCIVCRQPFGQRGKDGFTVYKFNTSGVCTMCVDYDLKEASRKYNRDEKDRRE